MSGYEANPIADKNKNFLNENIFKGTASPLNKKVPSYNILDIKPYPKFDLRAKPEGNIKRSNCGVSSSSKEIKKVKFDHIISPVGTYMKKTPVTPLMSNMKQRSSNKLPESKVCRTLKFDSPNEIQGDGATALTCNTMEQKILPKRAYVSPSLVLVKDERLPILIPGGKKIHKYLDSATIPSVWKHKGKFQMVDVTNDQCLKYATSPFTKNGAVSNIVNNINMSELDVMSNDISLYTIMDA